MFQMRTQKQFIRLSGKWLCQHLFWETWISADFAQLDKIFVSKGYTMSFSPAYAKRTCWPRAEALTVMFYWVNVQRSRLCPSKEMCIQGKSFWVMSLVGLPGLISAYELAYQSGSQNWKCHLRSPTLQTIFHLRLFVFIFVWYSTCKCWPEWHPGRK